MSEERSESISPEDAEEILIDYYQRVKNRRLAEAEIFWANLLTKGVDEKSIIAIDFKISSPEKNDANLVSKQLSENYSMSITFAEELKTHIVEGTTKPAGLSLTKEQFIGWIDFMSDVSAQYNSIFLTWTFETHEPKMIFESEGIETDLP